jgi:PEP-CTERM motif
MNNPKTWRKNGVRVARGAALAFLLAGTALHTQGDILNQGNSTAILDLTGAGMTSWTVDGQNQLGQQWFWYGIGNGPESAISAISAPAVSGVVPPLGKLTVAYANADYSVKVGYTLTGGTAGSGRSSMSELITVANTTASTLDFRLFQYNDFNLLGATANQSVNLASGDAFNPTIATQQAGLFSVTTSVIPSVSRLEADSDGHVLASLLAGGPTVLVNNSGIPAGPGNANYTFEWDFMINPGGSADIISYLTQIQVPEPAPASLIGLGLGALALGGRRRIRAGATKQLQ